MVFHYISFPWSSCCSHSSSCVVHDSQYYIIFSNIELGWQEEVFKMNAISYLSFLHHFILTIFIFGQNPLYSWWYDIILSTFQVESLWRTSNKKQYWPVVYKIACRVVFVILVSLFRSHSWFSSQKPYTFVIFDNF